MDKPSISPPLHGVVSSWIVSPPPAWFLLVACILQKYPIPWAAPTYSLCAWWARPSGTEAVPKGKIPGVSQCQLFFTPTIAELPVPKSARIRPFDFFCKGKLYNFSTNPGGGSLAIKNSFNNKTQVIFFVFMTFVPTKKTTDSATIKPSSKDDFWLHEPQGVFFWMWDLHGKPKIPMVSHQGTPKWSHVRQSRCLAPSNNQLGSTKAAANFKNIFFICSVKIGIA